MEASVVSGTAVLHYTKGTTMMMILRPRSFGTDDGLKAAHTQGLPCSKYLLLFEPHQPWLVLVLY